MHNLTRRAILKTSGHLGIKSPGLFACGERMVIVMDIVYSALFSPDLPPPHAIAAIIHAGLTKIDVRREWFHHKKSLEQSRCGMSKESSISKCSAMLRIGEINFNYLMENWPAN